MTKKTYPEIRYSGKRVSECGHQPVYKQILPDGELTELSPVPSQKLYNHSPDGFQWGYGGSGPAQLALAILLDVTGDPETTSRYSQDFKCDFVAKWGENWEVTSDVILAWIEKTKAEYAALMASRN